MCNSRLSVGWRVSECDVPDAENRLYGDLHELRELAGIASELLDRDTSADELCEFEDMPDEGTLIVGVPMFDHEMPMGEFEERTDKLADLATKVYRQVMRKEPEDGPYLISWTQVS